MAEELRGQFYEDGGVADITGQMLLTNTASEDIYVRSVHITSFANNNAAADGYNEYQISKSPIMQSADGLTGIFMDASVVCSPGDASGAGQLNRSWYFAKGQFTLEPGETLYYSSDVTGTLNSHIAKMSVWYHY